MKAAKSIFLIFVTLLSLFVSVTGLVTKIELPGRILQILFLPVTAYLLFVLTAHVTKKAPVYDQKSGIRRVFTYYCFIVTTTLVSVGFFSAQNPPQLISALIFSPMAVYFLLLVWPKRKQALPLKGSELASPIAPMPKLDVNRRDFLKLIGSAGILAIILGLFSRKSGVSLLGNVENLEPLSLKNASGDVIDPAENSPTDGYSITQIDDSTPSYFGFVNKSGDWFIMREGEDSAYRYAKGGGNFASNWANRAILDYNYFDKVF